jgi:DNA-directed RNA polymerase specialized sigma24 family protein
MSDVTRILSEIEQGDPQAAAELLPLVYDELRKLAAAKLAQEKPGQTLQATALVHEAYLRLVGGGVARNQQPVASEEKPEVRDQKSAEELARSDFRPLTSDLWHSRGHFFAAAAEAMRRILVENARHKLSQRSGGDWQRLELSDVLLTTRRPSVDVLALSAALEKLETIDTRKAALVKLRFFTGLTNQEAALALGISTATADNDWAYAKSWLKRELARDVAGR